MNNKNININWIRHGKIIDVEHLDVILHPNKIGLSEEGQINAQKIENKINIKETDIVYCSNIKRAKETVEILLKNKKSIFERVIYDSRLNEFFPEELFEQKLDLVKEKYGKDFFQKFLDDPLNCQLFKDSENITEACERINRFFKDILSQHTSGVSIWIIGHGTLHNIWLLSILNESLSNAFNKYRLNYLSRTTVDYDPMNKLFHIKEINKNLTNN